MLIAIYHGKKNVSGQRVSEALGALGIDARMISARDIAAGRLAEFSGVIFPGGHSIVLSKTALAATKSFIRNGGGMIGICAGAQFGAHQRLLNVTHHVLRAMGEFDLRVIARHPVSAGYTVAGQHAAKRPWRYSNRGRVRMRYANGGWIECGAGVHTIVSMDEQGRMATVVAGQMGRGRVVLITPHPESTPQPAGQGADSDHSQEPLPMFGNAVKWIAGHR